MKNENLSNWVTVRVCGALMRRMARKLDDDSETLTANLSGRDKYTSRRLATKVI